MAVKTTKETKKAAETKTAKAPKAAKKPEFKKPNPEFKGHYQRKN